MERTGCYGNCPVYKITLFRNGDALLEAKAFMAQPTGTYKGRVYPRDYARLCLALERFRFANMKGDYRAGWTDDATCIVTATSKDRVKVVSDYGEVGPVELWTIQAAIDQVRERIQWSPAVGDVPKP